MIRPLGVAHVNLNVTDLGRSLRFYTELLGFQVAFQYEGTVAWLNVGQYRADVQGMGRGFHDVALYQVPGGLPADYRKRAGLNHLALRLPAPADVDAAAEELRAAGVKLLKGPLTHKEDNDRYLYLEDPDGNVIELVASTLPDWPAAYLRAAPAEDG
ncbi:MAG TPA: VOC family protein [Chloroflexota bacterium]|jgi:catechol 2,3-dioxygenase-like lactoylglutathione lyase family enzyme